MASSCVPESRGEENTVEYSKQQSLFHKDKLSPYYVSGTALGTLHTLHEGAVADSNNIIANFY